MKRKKKETTYMVNEWFPHIYIERKEKICTYWDQKRQWWLHHQSYMHQGFCHFSDSNCQRHKKHGFEWCSDWSNCHRVELPCSQLHVSMQRPTLTSVPRSQRCSLPRTTMFIIIIMLPTTINTRETTFAALQQITINIVCLTGKEQLIVWGYLFSTKELNL